MTSDRYLDYDAAFAEADAARQPLVRRLFGVDWELPAVPPAAVVIRMSRMAAAGRAEEDLTAGEIMLIAADLIPQVTLDAWLAEGLDTEQLSMILMDLMAEYAPYFSVDSEAEGADPEGQAPQGATPPPMSSPSTGPNSKPTSPANIVSPFQKR